jgi:hypothetical protein
MSAHPQEVRSAFPKIQPPKLAPKPLPAEEPIEPPIQIEIQLRIVHEEGRPNYGYCFYRHDEALKKHTISVALNTAYSIVTNALQSTNHEVVSLLIGFLVAELLIFRWQRPANRITRTSTGGMEPTAQDSLSIGLHRVSTLVGQDHGFTHLWSPSPNPRLSPNKL